MLELKGLLHGLLRRDERNSAALGNQCCSLCGNMSSGEEEDGSERQKSSERLRLESETHRTAEKCEKMSLALKQNDAELKRKDEDIHELQSKVSLCVRTLIKFLTSLKNFVVKIRNDETGKN